MSDDLTHFQIKNLHTNELLVADWDSKGYGGAPLVLSANCSDCSSSKWEIEEKNTMRSGYFHYYK